MKRELLQDFLDGALSRDAELAFLASLSEAERADAQAMKKLTQLAGEAASPMPRPDFAARAMARIRTRPAPRRSLLTWLRTPAISPIHAVTASAAAALLIAVAVSHAPISTTSTAPTAAPQASATGVPSDKVLARFVLKAPLARDVSLAGDFNGWKPDATRLKREPNGHWSIEVALEPGHRYQYMFVIDGKEWLTDPAAVATVDDGFGGANAVLDI